MQKDIQDLVNFMAGLEFHIGEMTELIVRDYRLCVSLIRQQSSILQSLQSVRDTLIKLEEPKKD